MDYAENLEQIKQWAKDLIILQYHRSEKNQKLIDLMVENLFASNLIWQIQDLCLNVDKSIGAQLEVVGKWVGIDPYINDINLWNQPYVSLVNYSNIREEVPYDQWQGGFSSYNSSSPYFFGNDDGGFLTYKTWRNVRTERNKMGDAFFRELIKLKIIKNSIKFTNKNIDEAIYKWGREDIYTTWQPMEVTYHFPLNKVWNEGTPEEISVHNLMQLAVYKNVLLAPTGCKIKTEAY